MKTPIPTYHIVGIKKYCAKIVCTFILLFFSSNSFSQTLAFPEAEGFGKNAIGGRGGVVYKVTNLNNSGSGSLRAACEAFGPRTVVFEVSGTINLTSDLIVNNPYLTIAGQTAPGDGICVRGASFRPRTSNIIVRYIRFRLGDNGYKNASGNIVGPDGSDSDTVGLSGSSGLIQDIIFDHCSMSWSIDELIGIYGGTSSGTGVNDITFQYCIFSEALWNSHHEDGSHSMSFLMNENSQNISIYKNLFAHSRERHIRAGGGCSFEMINNVVYNFRYSSVISYDNEFSMINNHYKAGSQAVSSSYVADMTSQSGYNIAGTKAYITGNTNDAGMSEIDSGFNPYLLSSPLITSGIVPDNVPDAIADVLSNSGAILPSRDSIDERIINEYNTTTGSIIDTPAEVGGYPTLNSTAPLTDTDNDGMPDSWETENGLNINDASDRNIVQADGYTNLEYYLNNMSLTSGTFQVNAGNDVTICEGVSTTLTATGADSYVWMPGNIASDSIDINPTTNTTYTVTGTHSDGSTTSDTVEITVTPKPIADAGQDVETCQGTAVTLTANGGTSYLWNTGATTQSISVNPNTTTTYSVEANQNGCVSELDEVIVTVNPLPNVDAGSDLTINYGESTTLTANGADSYLWSTGETTQSITVNPAIETTYTVTGTTDTCQNTDSITVFLFGSEVVANAGDDQTICNGLQTTLTATGGAAYVWNTGETTASINVSPINTTTYTVTAFDATGTVSDTDDVTVNITANPVANAGSDVEICQDSSVTLTASGGTSYLWNTGETTESIIVTPNTTTTYSVEVFENNCSNSDDILVTVNALPLVDAGSDVTITEGESTTLTASGAQTYQWSTGETTQSIEVSPTSTITYTVTGFSNSCESTADVTVTVETETIVANAGVDVTICEGESTILTATGGATYEWNTGETTASIEVSPSSSTSYIVTASNASGTISDSDVVLVTVTALPLVDAGSDVTITEGESTTLTASGAQTYQWSTGETTQSIEVSPTSTITYTVTGFSNSCESTADVTVTVETETIVANAGVDVTICEGESTILTATGGATYEWNTGETTASIEVSPSSSTSYIVTASNASGTISDSDVVLVTVTALPLVDAGSDVTITEGESTTLTASGAQTYQWSTGETTQSIEVSPTSTITYTVTGFSNSCESTADVTVTVETETIVANAGVDVTICEGESTILTATGGATYEWNTGETTASIEVSPSSSTSYIVTASNASGTISDSDVVLVTVTALPLVDAGSDVTITEGESTTLTASGAQTYQWSTGETTQSIEVSPTSTITYTVTGFTNSCESTADVTVTVETETIVANAGVDVTICEGESTILTATGGATYEWNTGETTASIEVSPSSSTSYIVTASNASGTISDSDVVLVTVTVLPLVDAGSDVTITEGESTTLTASGAQTYQWSTGETTQSIEVSPTSTITYTVTGFTNSCESTADVTVTVETETIVANAGVDVTICEGESTILTATGGATYEWNTGETTASIEVSPSSSTSYIVTASNASGTISDSDVVLVTVNTLPLVDAGSDVTITEGESTILTASGAQTYQWSTGETTQSIEVSPTSTITYTVTGFTNSCEATTDVTVTVETETIVANAGVDVTICEGESTILTATGGAAYEWNTGETTASIEVSPSSSTSYIVTASNASGTISDSDVVLVTVTALPLVDAGSDVTITEGESTTLTASGAQTYQWSTGETTQSIEVSPTSTITYTVTGFSNSCESTADVTVTVEPFVYSAYAGEDQSICEGTSTVLTVSEGDAYLWSTGETTQSISVSPWTSETFTVTVFEGDEQAQDDVTVFVNLNPNVVIVNGGEVTILEGEFITLSASGANTYEWDNGATQPNIAVSPSLSRTYSVTGYINDCSDEKSVTVNVLETVEAYAGEDLTVCSNEMVTLTANEGNSEDEDENEEYLWNTGETTKSINVTPGTDTEYSVLVYNELSSDEATVMVYVNDCSPVEIPVEEEFDVLIYQDVIADVLKVQISGLDRVDVDQIAIYDMTGKVIYSEQIRTEENAQSLNKEIDSSQFSRGIYIVRLIYDDTELLKKIPIR